MSSKAAGIAFIVELALTALASEMYFRDADRERSLNKAFVSAGVPDNARSLSDVNNTIFRNGGNCGALKSDLQQPCERAKESLHVQYGPHGKVMSWQRP
ncbi:MAG TPA: hypothetical protein VL625_11170 [Patescibacteria group bacterium]|nr:hypothetical protein [Patescibacteria group bacterium]